MMPKGRIEFRAFPGDSIGRKLLISFYRYKHDIFCPSFVHLKVHLFGLSHPKHAQGPRQFPPLICVIHDRSVGMPWTLSAAQSINLNQLTPHLIHPSVWSSHNAASCSHSATLQAVPRRSLMQFRASIAQKSELSAAKAEMSEMQH